MVIYISLFNIITLNKKYIYKKKPKKECQNQQIAAVNF